MIRNNRKFYLKCLLVITFGLFLGFINPSIPDDTHPINKPEVPIRERTLEVLEKTYVPENDIYETAYRYKNVKIDFEKKLPAPPQYVVGEVRDFYVLNVSSNSYSMVTTKLEFITDHLYFWIEDGINFNFDDLEYLSQTFENDIYSLNRDFFGSEDSPGIDNDEHLYVLFVTGMGGAAGYFSSSDAIPREIEEFSNEADMFFLSAVYNKLNQEFTFGVLAHEFQHMIHWNFDKNEELWLNEGLAELAAFVNGFDPGGFDDVYARKPDLQLNYWPPDYVESSTPHYGASYLFLHYFMDQFGEGSVKKLVNDPKNAFDSIDNILEEQFSNGKLNQPLKSEDLFQNWTIANLIQDSNIYDGIYGYKTLTAPPNFYAGNTIDCDTDLAESFEVHQFGVDYIRVDCDDVSGIEFQGKEVVKVITADPFSGDYYLWSNKGDQSSMTLTKTFDFSNVYGPIYMRYHTWYDIERDWDYLYLLASENGQDWEQVKTPSCSEENITGSNHGCGYNGQTDEWIYEEIDLSQFAGREVTLQFEYLTDMAINGEGFVIDDISIDAIDYFSDFEQNSGGWATRGFVRIANELPQVYRIGLIKQSPSNIDVDLFEVDGDENISLSLQKTPEEKIYLSISGVSRYTWMPAIYKLKFIE